MKITSKVVEQIKFSGKTLDVTWDSALKDFGLRCYSSGKKAYVVRFFEGNKRCIRALGLTTEIELVEARETAKALLQDKRLRRKFISVRASPRMNDFALRYLQHHSQRYLRSWKEDLKRINLYVMPMLGRYRLEEITPSDILELHASISQKAPIQANRVVALIRGMFNKAKDWGLFEGINPANRIKFNAEHARESFVNNVQMPKLIAAIDAEHNIYVRSALWLYLLTGLRKSEILTARWDYIDSLHNLLILPKTKNNKKHLVYLSLPALSVLRQTPTRENNPYIICGRRTGRHLVNISKPWYRVRDAAGLGNMRLHDLRHTVATNLDALGCSPKLIGQVLNNPKAVKRYIHSSTKPLSDALEQHGQMIQAFKNNLPTNEFSLLQ